MAKLDGDRKRELVDATRIRKTFKCCLMLLEDGEA